MCLTEENNPYNLHVSAILSQFNIMGTESALPIFTHTFASTQLLKWSPLRASSVDIHFTSQISPQICVNAENYNCLCAKSINISKSRYFRSIYVVSMNVFSRYY